MGKGGRGKRGGERGERKDESKKEIKRSAYKKDNEGDLSDAKMKK